MHVLSRSYFKRVAPHRGGILGATCDFSSFCHCDCENGHYNFIRGVEFGIDCVRGVFSFWFPFRFLP